MDWPSAGVARLRRAPPADARLASGDVAGRPARTTIARIVAQVGFAAVVREAVTVGVAGAASEAATTVVARDIGVVGARTGVAARTAVLRIIIEIDAGRRPIRWTEMFAALALAVH